MSAKHPNKTTSQRAFAVPAPTFAAYDRETDPTSRPRPTKPGVQGFGYASRPLSESREAVHAFDLWQQYQVTDDDFSRGGGKLAPMYSHMSGREVRANLDEHIRQAVLHEVQVTPEQIDAFVNSKMFAHDWLDTSLWARLAGRFSEIGAGEAVIHKAVLPDGATVLSSSDWHPKTDGMSRLARAGWLRNDSMFHQCRPQPQGGSLICLQVNGSWCGRWLTEGESDYTAALAKYGFTFANGWLHTPRLIPLWPAATAVCLNEHNRHIGGCDDRDAQSTSKEQK